MAAKQGAAASARTNALFASAMVLFTVALLVFIAELIVRFQGNEPWELKDAEISVEPGGRLFEQHPTLGYRHLPGQFAVGLGPTYEFQVTHDQSGLRTTSRADRADAASEQIWIFGCSFTHGWSVDDDETYPWKLQEKFPDYEVVNFGVNGYGTLHSLIQFREALAGAKPRVAVLAYANFHDMRNTFSRSRRKAVVPWNKLGALSQPYARLDSNDELEYEFAEFTYREFPLMRVLALSHLIEENYNAWEMRSHRAPAVTRALLIEMAALAKANGVEFVLANLHAGMPLLEFAKERGIRTADISVNRMRRENSNLPHDRHPSPLAHSRYANNLAKFLRNETFSDRR